MIRFLKANQEWVLAGIGLLLLCLLAWSIIWVTTEISMDLGSALSAGGRNGAKAEFNLDQAKALNVHGSTQSGK